MAGYLWHEISEKEKAEIKESAKSLMLDFGKVLESIEGVEDACVERDDFVREESEPEICDKEFRKIMLDNAPNSDDNFIFAEKGSWVK